MTPTYELTPPPPPECEDHQPKTLLGWIRRALFKAFYWGAFATLFNLVVTAPALGIFWYNEAPPVLYSARSVMTPKVIPGQILSVHIASQVQYSLEGCSGTVYRTIVDASGRRFDFVGNSRNTQTDFIVEIQIPLEAATGKAVYLARVDWRCNPIQRFFPYAVYQSPLEFEIVDIDPTQTQPFTPQLPTQKQFWQIPSSPPMNLQPGIAPAPTPQKSEDFLPYLKSEKLGLGRESPALSHNLYTLVKDVGNALNN